MRRLSTEAASAASAWGRWTQALASPCPLQRAEAKRRRLREGGLTLLAISDEARSIRICKPQALTQYSRPHLLAQRLLDCRRGVPGEAIRLHHQELESSEEALHRRDIGCRSAAERTQCRAEPVDGSVETVGYRRDDQVPHRADGLTLREVLEVRSRSRLREQPLRGRAMSRASSSEAGSRPSPPADPPLVHR